MNRIPREEILAIVFFIAVFIIIGAVGGYSARAISSRDKFLVSTAAKHFAEQEYYQTQINQIIKEGSKGEPNGKSR